MLERKGDRKLRRKGEGKKILENKRKMKKNLEKNKERDLDKKLMIEGQGVKKLKVLSLVVIEVLCHLLVKEHLDNKN